MRILTFILLIFVCSSQAASGQSVSGKVTDAANGLPLPWCAVRVMNSSAGTYTQADGTFTLSAPSGEPAAVLLISRLGYFTDTLRTHSAQTNYEITLRSSDQTLNTVVVTGTMKPVTRSESTVAIDVITPKLFARSAAVCLFDAAGMLNGVQPQVSCNVCNAGDLRINGMEGPYTMVLIDGMPIVSALSSVYGLNGIPVSLIERVEVMKGPASSLYGSEAMGGIINIITRDPECAPKLSFDVSGTSWQEFSGDAAASFGKKKIHGLLGINAFNYTQPQDANGDGFMDMSLQQRISVFNKYTFTLRENRKASLAARVVLEERNGGQMNFTPSLRGSDQVYGESITTRRAEVIGLYPLPLREKVTLQFSFNSHAQDSWYGLMRYTALQTVGFTQLVWEKNIGKHNLLGGAAFRFTHYDDNTPATASETGIVNSPMRTPLPGIFMQDEITFNPKHRLLLGWRSDYDQNHGLVHSPRMAYRWNLRPYTTLRLAAGTGYRVVNLFAEDHAALSGARNVVIAEALRPERSANFSANLYRQLFFKHLSLTLDASAFFTRFSNKIVADYDSNPNEIIYANLRGHAVTQGAALNADAEFTFPLTLSAGITYMDVALVTNNAAGHTQRTQQLHAPRWSGTFSASYEMKKLFTVDLTGRWLGPMRLPILPNDFRPEYSPAFCLVNLQLRKSLKHGFEVYAGVRNLLNFLPQNPIMRPFDPFDREVNDPVNNPHGYTFDPSYTYAPVQGIRGFAGVRWTLK
ncbi:MAG: TonB-dependent receptor [Bacteroidia bacterium]|jgi:outer membrane receptor for ferrienterochelin and colicins|nr:TonB-dependent receptor [Bacteroidia bacterium]